MARGIGTRYLFLLIRGIDQTGRALTKPLKDMTALQKAEANLGRQSYRLMFAGAAFTTFGLLATRALLRTMEYSTRGARVLGDFGEAIERLKKAIGERIVDKMGDTITGWIDSLDALADNEMFKFLTGEIGLTLTIGAVVIGVGLTAAAITAALLAKLVILLQAAGFVSAAAATGMIAGMMGTIFSFAIPIVLTMIVADIIWKILPKQYREHAAKLKADAQAWADKTGIPVRFGQRDIAYPTGMTQGGARQAGITGAQIVNNTNLFIDTLSTKAEDEDELAEILDQIIVDATINLSGFDQTTDDEI